MLATGSKNIILRAVEYKDKAQLSLLANNKNIWNNLKDYIPSPFTDKDSEYFIDLTMKENPQVKFAIEYYGNFAGVIGLVPLKDVYRKSAEIGYWVGEPYWNNNIATEAVKSITRYGLLELNFTRIQAGVFEYNKASMRVLEKCNYKKEGIFVKSVWKNNKLWDEHKYAIVYQSKN
jgi:RimJ/RimL family protein N-acetyltransferase